MYNIINIQIITPSQHISNFVPFCSDVFEDQVEKLLAYNYCCIPFCSDCILLVGSLRLQQARDGSTSYVKDDLAFHNDRILFGNSSTPCYTLVSGPFMVEGVEKTERIATSEQEWDGC